MNIRSQIEQVIQDQTISCEDAAIKVLGLILEECSIGQGYLYHINKKESEKYIAFWSVNSGLCPFARTYIKEEIYSLFREALDESDIEIYNHFDPDRSRVDHFVELFYDGLDTCEYFHELDKNRSLACNGK